MILLLPILILVGLCCYGLMKQQVPLAQSLTILCYIFLFFLFLIGVAIDVHPYDKAIDLLTMVMSSSLNNTALYI